MPITQGSVGLATWHNTDVLKQTVCYSHLQNLKNTYHLFFFSLVLKRDKVISLTEWEVLPWVPVSQSRVVEFTQRQFWLKVWYQFPLNTAPTKSHHPSEYASWENKYPVFFLMIIIENKLVNSIKVFYKQLSNYQCKSRNWKMFE